MRPIRYLVMLCCPRVLRYSQTFCLAIETIWFRRTDGWIGILCPGKTSSEHKYDALTWYEFTSTTAIYMSCRYFCTFTLLTQAIRHLYVHMYCKYKPYATKLKNMHIQSLRWALDDNFEHGQSSRPTFITVLCLWCVCLSKERAW